MLTGKIFRAAAGGQRVIGLAILAHFGSLHTVLNSALNDRSAVRKKAGEMPITVELRENGHVIYAVFAFPYTLQDAIDNREKEKALRDKGCGMIHSLLNMSAGGKPPNGVLKVAREGPSFIHPTRGKIAIVGASFFSQTIVQMASKLARRRFENIHFFQSEEQAWTFLREQIAQEQAKTA
jgi:hypothetical protein